MKRIIFFLVLGFAFNACGQNKRSELGEQYAKDELKKSLIDSSVHNIVNNESIIIKDKNTAINVVEPILFEIYGKEKITKQRPYECYFIDKYWIVIGTLPNNYLGGTFLIILDSRNSKIIRITHGK